MPYPSQITRETILETARSLIEAQGVEKLSLHKLASELGVTAPSLYRYVRNKTELLQAVNALTIQALFAALDAAMDAQMPLQDRLLALAWAYRRFALAYPATYDLAFTNTLAEMQSEADLSESGILAIQRVVGELSGEALSLPALRGIWALIHGFVVLEMNGQFRRGGDLEEAFEIAMRAYLRGWLPQS